MVKLRLLLIGCCALIIAGCGSGGGEFVPPNGSVPPPPSTSGTYLRVDLTTKQLVPTSSTAPAGANEIAFREILTGETRVSTADSVTGTGTATGAALGAAPVGRHYLGLTEVTQSQWQSLVAASGTGVTSTPWTSGAFANASGATLPVCNVTQVQIATVLEAWNNKSSYRLRLPTGTEWENACRAGSAGTWSWGNDARTSVAGNFALVQETGTGIGSAAGAAPVASRSANAWGFYDLHGNVWEWVSNGGVSNAPCLRGGSWSDSLNSAQSGNRLDLPTNVPFPLAGLRLVLETR